MLIASSSLIESLRLSRSAWRNAVEGVGDRRCRRSSSSARMRVCWAAAMSATFVAQSSQ